MSRKRLADYVADYLRSENCTSVGWGDGSLINGVPESAYRFKTKPSHPLNKMAAVCASMDRATDIFEKRFRRSMDIKGSERVVRCYILK